MVMFRVRIMSTRFEGSHGSSGNKRSLDWRKESSNCLRVSFLWSHLWRRPKVCPFSWAPSTLSPGSIFGLLRNGTWTVCAPSWRGVFWLIGPFYQFMVMICTGFWLARAQPEGPHYCLSFRTAWRYWRSLNCISWRGLSLLHLSVKRGWRLNGPFGRIDSP